MAKRDNTTITEGRREAWKKFGKIKEELRKTYNPNRASREFANRVAALAQAVQRNSKNYNQNSPEVSQGYALEVADEAFRQALSGEGHLKGAYSATQIYNNLGGGNVESVKYRVNEILEKSRSKTLDPDSKQAKDELIEYLKTHQDYTGPLISRDNQAYDPNQDQSPVISMKLSKETGKRRKEETEFSERKTKTSRPSETRHSGLEQVVAVAIITGAIAIAAITFALKSNPRVTADIISNITTSSSETAIGVILIIAMLIGFLWHLRKHNKKC